MRNAAWLRSWSAVHSTRPALTVWLLAVLVGLAVGSVTIPSLGPVQLPDLFPVNALLTVAVGSGLALLTDYRVDPRAVALAPGRRRLVAARLAWCMVGGSLSILASLLVAPSEGLSVAAFAANALLFLGLGIIMVAAGRPDLAWLPASSWVLMGLLFGYRGAGPADWYPWAFPLAASASPVRFGASVAVWLSAVVVWAVLPLLRGLRHP